MIKWEKWGNLLGRIIQMKGNNAENGGRQKDSEKNELFDVKTVVDFTENQENHAPIIPKEASTPKSFFMTYEQSSKSNDAEIHDTVLLDVHEQEPYKSESNELKVIVPRLDSEEHMEFQQEEYGCSESIDGTRLLDVHEQEPLDSGRNSNPKLEDDIRLPSARLRCVSVNRSKLPLHIDVEIGLGGEYTIGRFDAVVGFKQSDFEFEKNTKAVSRHHAVIKRFDDGYSITDTGSTSGTYINEVKIAPNNPNIISNGDLIYFGNAGADYIWECSR